jgi:hypothetical protein
MSPTSERAAAFAFAALTPAALTGVYFLALGIRAPGDAGFGPGLVFLAFIAFMLAFVIAGLHILALAVPLYRFLSQEEAPGAITILVASFLIGAMPMPMLFGAATLEPFVLLGLLGLTGGVTFLLVAGLPGKG